MSSNIDTNSSEHSRHQGLWCGRSTSGGIFCGSMMVIIGGIWIGKKTGLIPLDMDLFWPAVMVVLGAWVLAANLFRRGKTS
jgi:hypothetical protein